MFHPAGSVSVALGSLGQVFQTLSRNEIWCSAALLQWSCLSSFSSLPHMSRDILQNFCIGCIGMTLQPNRPLTYTFPIPWVSMNSCCLLSPLQTAFSSPVLPLSSWGQHWFILVWICNEDRCILAVIIETPGLI